MSHCEPQNSTLPEEHVFRTKVQVDSRGNLTKIETFPLDFNFITKVCKEHSNDYSKS